MKPEIRSALRITVRLLLSVLLLAVVSHGFGLHRHADSQSHPESCALCRAAVTPLLLPTVAVSLVLPAPFLPPADVSHADPVEAPVAQPPSRAPPCSFV